MVEVGSLQIGGSIQTSEIERGMRRIQGGFKEISEKGKSVEGDFERISARGKKLVAIFGGMAIAGVGALTAFAKGAPALAGSMAKINLSMLKLKMAAGEALKPTFDGIARALDKLSGWVGEHPDLFRGIVTSIAGVAVVATAIKIGGWIYKAFSGFFGLLKGISIWKGWATIGSLFKGLGTTIKNIGKSVGTAFSSIIEWFGKLSTKIGSLLTGGASGSILRSIFGVGGAVTGFALPALTNTYQREITGKSGYLDRQIQEYNNYQFQQQLKKMSRNQSEMDYEYFI